MACECEPKKALTFKLREMQYQDANGRQFVVRLDDSGNVVFSGAFDQRGDEVQLKDGETIELSIAIKGTKREKDVLATQGKDVPATQDMGAVATQALRIPEKEVLAAQVCMCPYQVGGKTYYYPC
jgi:hypothetical protein